MIAAVAENGVIGRDGGLPWRLSSDLKRFKADTMGKPVIMGRKTWASLGKPLPGRLNIVLTRDRTFQEPGTETAHSAEHALEIAQRARPEEICVIGGGDVYGRMMPFAGRLKLTHVLAAIDGDTHFPEVDPAIWRVIECTDYPEGEKDSHPTRYCIYERKDG